MESWFEWTFSGIYLKLHCSYWEVVCIVILFDCFWTSLTFLFHHLQRFLKIFFEPAQTDVEAGAAEENSKALWKLIFIFCSVLLLILLGDAYDVKNFTFSLFLLNLCSEIYRSSSSSCCLFAYPHHPLSLYYLGEAPFPREQDLWEVDAGRPGKLLYVPVCSVLNPFLHFLTTHIYLIKTSSDFIHWKEWITVHIYSAMCSFSTLKFLF